MFPETYILLIFLGKNIRLYVWFHSEFSDSSWLLWFAVWMWEKMSFSGKYSFKNLFQNSICLLYPGDVSSILLLQLILRYYIIQLFRQLLFCNRYLYFVCIDVWNIIDVLFVNLSYMHVLYCRLLAYLTLQGFGDFEDGFMLEWGNKLTLGTNYFTDPMGNVMNLEFGEDLIRKGIFRILPFLQILNLVSFCLSLCHLRSCLEFRNKICVPLVLHPK